MADAETAPTRLSELLADTRTLALVGLAKNTGKTETLAALLREHAAAGRPVGVTSIGRDGEEHDVIDARIEKPRVLLQTGDLVATTGALLRSSGVAHERLSKTGVRTPLGEVVLARMSQPGAVEVAGPSSAADLRAIGEEMLALGAEQALLDGAIDRRAASSPAVADGLVMATGAILGEDIEDVVRTTSDAVDLVRLPVASEDRERVTLGRRLVLNAEPAEIAALLREHPESSSFGVEGALGERFLEGLLAARSERAGRELQLVAGDATKVFLTRRGPRWYARQGIAIEVLRPIALKAITVNPLAPQSHRFDSRMLRGLIGEAVANVPILDVLDESYLTLLK
ncbi:MAG TPA: hypothetical protein VHW67_07475 [Solirubrobacteraceae bacterium]|jgi:hypothetical protein|nr:hypothetical protein [Solirubrobacteraceae bacterium]